MVASFRVSQELANIAQGGVLAASTQRSAFSVCLVIPPGLFKTPGAVEFEACELFSANTVTLP